MKNLIKAEVRRLTEAYTNFDLMSELDCKKSVEVAPKVEKRALEALKDIEKLFRNVSAVVGNVELKWEPNGETMLTFYGGPNSMLFSHRYATRYFQRELHEATGATTSVIWVWPDYGPNRRYKIKIELRVAP